MTDWQNTAVSIVVSDGPTPKSSGILFPQLLVNLPSFLLQQSSTCVDDTVHFVHATYGHAYPPYFDTEWMCVDVVHVLGGESCRDLHGSCLFTFCIMFPVRSSSSEGSPYALREIRSAVYPDSPCFVGPVGPTAGVCPCPVSSHRTLPQMQVTIDQVIGGARGIKSMIWETSNLDADEVSELGSTSIIGKALWVRALPLFRFQHLLVQIVVEIYPPISHDYS